VRKKRQIAQRNALSQAPYGVAALGLPHDPTTERILKAAHACFERFGIPKTTIGDIANAAGLSRPTVYKHFSGKDEIVDHLSAIEANELAQKIRNDLKGAQDLEARLVRVLLVGTRAAKNPYVRRSIETVYVPSRIADSESPIHKLQKLRWSHYLDAALKRGELATDISRDEIISWLSLAQTLLLIRVDAVQLSDKELERFIARFLVRPLLGSKAS
jgi:AcrR family transcriptional regulator